MQRLRKWFVQTVLKIDCSTMVDELDLQEMHETIADALETIADALEELSGRCDELAEREEIDSDDLVTEDRVCDLVESRMSDISEEIDEEITDAVTAAIKPILARLASLEESRALNTRNYSEKGINCCV